MPTSTKPMPVFWSDYARAELGDDRYERALQDPRSTDLLVWNIFQTLETHDDQEYLAYRLQMLGGTSLKAPVRTQLWTGQTADPLLRPSRGFVEAMQQRTGTAADAAAGREAIEVPLRIESPDVLCLVDAVMDVPPSRDRVLRLIDAGLEHSRRLGKQLSVAMIYQGGTTAAKVTSALFNELRGSLATELPHQTRAKGVQLRDVSWQQLVRTWEAEADYLDVPGGSRGFLAHCRANDLY